ncbi:MAG TPA: choice-of-anchor D domain-containing protein, partial [Polyangiaceae bacterium]|nr:choice-of-anchor D domain-containing protein [Polyangiaceae bacterium]
MRRRGPGGRNARAAALSLLFLGAGWSACSVDDRVVDIRGAAGTQGIGNLQGSAGSGGMSGTIAVEPSSIELGPVVVGSPARARLRIQNTGEVVLGAPAVTLASGGPAFSVLQNSCESSLLPGSKLTPGQTCEVRVQLLAERAGEVSGQLAIDVAESLRNVALSAVGNAPGVLILSPAAGSSDQFGSVRLGSSAQFVFNLTNPGTTASGPLSLHLFNSDVTQVTGAPAGCVSGTTSLEAGETCDVALAFAPTRRGPSDALLVVTSEAVGSVGLPLSGRGVVAGSLGVSQSSLDFDGVVLGDAGDRV